MRSRPSSSMRRCSRRRVKRAAEGVRSGSCPPTPRFILPHCPCGAFSKDSNSVFSLFNITFTEFDVVIILTACLTRVSASTACLLARPATHGMSSEPNNAPTMESVSGCLKNRSTLVVAADVHFPSLAPSSENACSKRHESGVMFELTNRTKMARPAIGSQNHQREDQPLDG
jgi:hypothetical protein